MTIPKSVMFPQERHAFVKLIRVLNENPGLKLSPREWTHKLKFDDKFVTGSLVTQASNHLNLLSMMGFVVKELLLESKKQHVYTSLGDIPLREDLK